MKRINTANRAVDLFGAGKDGFKAAVAGVSDATYFAALWANHLQEAVVRTIEASGQVLSDTDYDQFVTAIKTLIDAQSGNYALDTGVANAYVVALDPPVAAYAPGMTVRFRTTNANTGTSTLDAGGGAKALKNDVGGALVAGDVPASAIVTATYDQPSDSFLINTLVPSQVLSPTEGDARYAALAGLATQLFSVASPTGAAHATPLSEFAAVLASAGYIKIPCIVAGAKRTFIIQFLTSNYASGTDNILTNVTWPIAFPNACLGAQVTNASPTASFTEMTATSATGGSYYIVVRDSGGAAIAAGTAFILAIGW